MTLALRVTVHICSTRTFYLILFPMAYDLETIYLILLKIAAHARRWRCIAVKVIMLWLRLRLHWRYGIKARLLVAQLEAAQ